MLDRTHWPNCASHALICCKNLPPHVQAECPSVQTQAAQLLSAWMAMCRDPQLYSPFAEGPVASDPLPNESQWVHVSNTQQLLVLHDARAIDIQWNRPMQTSQLTAWGGSPQEFNILFSFWTKWTRDAHPQATPITSWMQAFIIFLSVGGFKVPIISNSAYIGMAIFKFRILSRSLLKMCATSGNQFDDFFPDHETYTRWLPNFPKDADFPMGIFFMPKWNLTDTVVRLSSSGLNST